ncbi:MAG: thioesterase [Melioribacteraceae bacterium]|nr:thioesterase [Melioribacteraceae bacterium]
MQRFEILITVTKDDLDELNHVNNIRYVSWVNDIAQLHWENNSTKTIRNNYYWVLLNHFIEYKRPAFLNDTVKLKTYVTKSEGVTSSRIVEIYNNHTLKLLAKSETKWCLMSVDTNRPTRITEEIINLFN